MHTPEREEWNAELNLGCISINWHWTGPTDYLIRSACFMRRFLLKNMGPSFFVLDQMYVRTFKQQSKRWDLISSNQGR